MSAFRAAPHVESIPPMTPFVGPEQLMREGGHASLLRLGANESAFGPSPKAIQAMTDELPHLAWYGDPESYDLRSALATRHGCGIEHLSVGSGIDDVMGLAVRAFLSPGDAALATKGTYPTFGYHVSGFGGRLETVPYRAGGTLDIDALIAAARKTRPRIVYVANPDNPSGSLAPASEIARLFESLATETLLFLDEAYADFVDDGELFVPIVDARLLRARTFSKAYGMAGARVGYALTAPGNVRTFQKIRLHYGVNRNAQIGALVSLQDAGFKASVVAQTAQGREDYYALARSIGCGYLESCTNFVCLDFGNEARAAAVMNALLDRGVFVRKPAAAPLGQFVRISVGTTAERAEFAVRLRSVAEEIAA